MIRSRFSPWLLMLATAPAAVAAQTMVQALPAGTADQLAAQMRLLAGDANNLPALLAAGDLSVKLDDLGAAASFFARADKVDPRNGRSKAGEGAILVHAERPGEALRYFALAESYGYPPAAFAADRGLAYDLIGEQERAQRDYRLALRAAPDEETQRRYALSLAIAGKRDLADQELQPLLRKADRGAWRVHAFVLAMAGNVAEASRIATTMMPPGTAAGLQPFLEKLPTLAPVDRAFAVHFGEVRSTPQRIADARLVPALPALGPEPYAPRTTVAAVAPVSPAAQKGKRRGDDKRRIAVQVAVAVPAPEPLPQAPSYRGATGTPQIVTTRGVAPAAWPTAIVPGVRPSLAPAALASTMPLRPPVTDPVPLRTAVTAMPKVLLAPPAALPSVSGQPAAANIVARPPAVVPPETNAVVAIRDAPLIIAPPAPPPVVAISPAVEAAPTAAPPTTAAAIATPPAAATATSSRPASMPAPTITIEAAAVPTTGQPVIGRRDRSGVDDAVVARIVAALPIPAAELNVAGPLHVRQAAAAPDPDGVDKATEEKAARNAAAKALADKRAADRKVAADKKALADKKIAAAKKAEDEREAAAQKKLERANPERFWVQVSGGAYVADLPKAWAAVRAKGGSAFADHATGWTTPLRATNRVLAGPFKTAAEARAFVNKVRTGGIEAFPFTSDAGQVVTRLPAK